MILKNGTSILLCFSALLFLDRSQYRIESFFHVSTAFNFHLVQMFNNWFSFCRNRLSSSARSLREAAEEAFCWIWFHWQSSPHSSSSFVSQLILPGRKLVFQFTLHWTVGQYACICVRAFQWMHIFTCACVYARVYACICVHVYMHVRIYIYICI